MDSRLDFESERVSPGFFGEVGLGSKPGLPSLFVLAWPLGRPGLDPRLTSPKKTGDALSDSKSSLESIYGGQLSHTQEPSAFRPQVP